LLLYYKRHTVNDVNTTYTGTADPERCYELLKEFIPKSEPSKCNQSPCALGATYQPTLPHDMTFYAIGAFVIALTSLDAVDKDGSLSLLECLDKTKSYCYKVWYTHRYNIIDV